MVNPVRTALKQDIRSKYQDLRNGPPAPTPGSGPNSEIANTAGQIVHLTRQIRNNLKFQDPTTPEGKVRQMVQGCKLTQSDAARQVKDLIARDPQAYRELGREKVSQLAETVIKYRSGYQQLPSYAVGLLAGVPGAVLGALSGGVLGLVAAVPLGIFAKILVGNARGAVTESIMAGVLSGAGLGGAATAALALPVTAPMHLVERRQGKASPVDGFAPRRVVADVLSLPMGMA